MAILKFEHIFIQILLYDHFFFSYSLNLSYYHSPFNTIFVGAVPIRVTKLWAVRIPYPDFLPFLKLPIYKYAEH